MKDPVVAIVVLNWNGWADTVRCLESVFRSSYPDYTVVVCDNGSEDDSMNRIRDWAEGRRDAVATAPPVPRPISYRQLTLGQLEHGNAPIDAGVRLVLIEIGANLGFARGNNVGIRYALGCNADYVFVLNNDTVLHPSCIATLIKFGEDRPGAALMGPKILDLDSATYTQWPVTARLNFRSILFALSPVRRLIRHTALFKGLFYFEDSPAVVYAIPGSAMMFRAAALGKINLLDEETFIYWEEFIVAEKLREFGLFTFVVPGAVVWHAQGASVRRLGAKRFIENVRSERHFFEKYLPLPGWQRSVLKGIRLCAYVCRMSADGDYRRNFREFVATLFDR
jgi:GT2 family glycosyltransferase